MTSTQEANRRKALDAVTVGQIRERYNARLDAEIGELNRIIRNGYMDLHKAMKFLEEQIATTLTQMQNIDAMASSVALFSQPKTD